MKSRGTAFILAALSALGPFSIDTYFASFPEIGSHFGVSELQVQQTLSFYLVALAGMNLFHGALSDAFGRRWVILTSLCVYSIAAFACITVPTFQWLLTFRVIQGLAGGAGMIVSRAVIRDCFEGSMAQKIMAQVTVVGGLGPAIAPILGGWLHVWFGWRGPFVFLGFLGALIWLGCYFGLSESLPLNLRQSVHPVRLVKSYTEMVREPAFLLLCLSIALGGGGFLLYVATAPDVALNILGLSKTQFGWLFIPIVSGMMAGSFTVARVAGRISPKRLVALGYWFMAGGAVLNVLANTCLAPRVPWAVLPLPLYTFGFALLAPAMTIECLDLFPRRKGLVSSLQGFFQTMVFAFVAGGLARLVYRSATKHAVALLALMSLSWLSYRGYLALQQLRESGKGQSAIT